MVDMTTTTTTERAIRTTWNGAAIDATVSDPPMTTTTVNYGNDDVPVVMSIYAGHVDGFAGIVVTTTAVEHGADAESHLASYTFPTSGDVTGSVERAMRAALTTVAAESFADMGYRDVPRRQSSTGGAR